VRKAWHAATGADPVNADTGRLRAQSS